MGQRRRSLSCLLFCAALAFTPYPVAQSPAGQGEAVSPSPFVRADVNADDSLDISDAVLLIEELFRTPNTIPCEDAGDFNDDGELDVSDVVGTIGWLFRAEDSPPAPFPLCGVDPTEDSLACESFKACSAPSSTPNIVIFMADDMGIGDTSVYQDLSDLPDNEQLHTPHLDSFAEHAIRFTDVHSPGATCSPTRYALLTGRYAFRARLVQGDNSTFILEDDRTTLPELLQTKGYGTYGVGKWHLGGFVRGPDDTLTGGPTDHGFDHFVGFHKDYTSEDTEVFVDDERKRFGSGDRLVPARRGVHAPERLTQLFHDSALEFMDSHARGGPRDEQPFFLLYGSQANHGSFIGPDSLTLDDGTTVPIKGRGRTVAGGHVPTSREGDSARTRARADRVRENDVVFGDLVNWLRQTPDPRRPGHTLWENSLIIFTSDNGADADGAPTGVGGLPKDGSSTTPATRLRGMKADAWEGGTRVPFLVCWPGRAPGGHTSHALFALNDLYATVAEIVGHALERAGPEEEAPDSISVLAALTGSATIDVRGLETLYLRRTLRRIAMRDGHWKLIAQALGSGRHNYDDMHFFDEGNLMTQGGTQFVTGLFDLSRDLGEASNLLDTRNYRDGDEDPRFRSHLSVAGDMLDTLQRQIDAGYTRRRR